MEVVGVVEADSRSKSNEKMEMVENAIVLISSLVALHLPKKMRLRVTLIDEEESYAYVLIQLDV